MPIMERFFTDILGVDHYLSDEMDEIKAWVEDAEYAGLTTVNDWIEGAMNYFLLYMAGLIRLDLKNFGDELIRLAFPDDSGGDFLEKIYARNGIFRDEGDYATTSLRIELEDDLDFDPVLEAGTEFGTDEAITYNLIEDVTIPRDEKIVHSLIQCDEVGIIGNVKAGTIINVFTELSFNISVTNLNDVINGVDSESDEDFKQRAKELATSNISVGTDLWVEKIAKTLVDDALCYDLDGKAQLLVFKPSINVTKQDLDNLFRKKEYRRTKNLIIAEAESVSVIDPGKSITLIIKNGFTHSTIINMVNSRIRSYVNKLKLGAVFKELCIKYLCESVEGVIYANLEGFSNIDLTNQQYGVIDDDLNIITENES
jgi:hypothetical protein